MSAFGTLQARNQNLFPSRNFRESRNQILTAAVQSTAVRDGVEIETHASQLAILSKENERITISHFQSTNVVDPK
jgi:hypothetical protein